MLTREVDSNRHHLAGLTRGASPCTLTAYLYTTESVHRSGIMHPTYSTIVHAHTVPTKRLCDAASSRPRLHAALTRTHPPVCVGVAWVRRAAGSSSLRVGRGSRPLCVGFECVTLRSRYIRADLLGLIGWRANFAAARRTPPTQHKLRLSLATNTAASGHFSSSPTTHPGERSQTAPADQTPARRRKNGA